MQATWIKLDEANLKVLQYKHKMRKLVENNMSLCSSMEEYHSPKVGVKGSSPFIGTILRLKLFVVLCRDKHNAPVTQWIE